MLTAMAEYVTDKALEQRRHELGDLPSDDTFFLSSLVGLFNYFSKGDRLLTIDEFEPYLLEAGDRRPAVAAMAEKKIAGN